MPKPLRGHRIKHWMARDRIMIVVVGCGGTGAALVAGLPYLHYALLAGGHPAGIRVCVIDGDRITETNCVRQPFSLGEVGLYKAQVLINRLNLFWGLDWDAIPAEVRWGRDVPDCDFMISCVDTRAARARLAKIVRLKSRRFPYWLDTGNSADSGQFVLGEPIHCIKLSLVMPPEARSRGQASVAVAGPLEGLKPIIIPVRTQEFGRNNSRELLVFFDPVLPANTGDYTITLLELVDDCMARLRAGNTDELYIRAHRRAAGHVKRMELIISLPCEKAARLHLENKLNQKNTGRPMSQKDLQAYYTGTPSFKPLGWYIDDANPDFGFGVDLSWSDQAADLDWTQSRSKVV